MKLPANEDDDEKVMSVPEVLEISMLSFLHCKVDHDSKAEGHNPPGSAGPGGKVSLKEGDELCATCLCGSIGKRELGKVDHVCSNMHDSADHNRPAGSFVEGDVLAKGNELVKGRATKKRDEIAADGEKDEEDINI